MLTILVFIYTNGYWYCYGKKCGVNETHTSSLHDYWNKEESNFKNPPNNPFSMNLAGKVNGGSKQRPFNAATKITLTMSVSYSITNLPNKESIRKKQSISENFYNAAQDLDIEDDIEKLSDFWSLK